MSSGHTDLVVFSEMQNILANQLIIVMYVLYFYNMTPVLFIQIFLS